MRKFPKTPGSQPRLTCVPEQRKGASSRRRNNKKCQLIDAAAAGCLLRRGGDQCKRMPAAFSSLAQYQRALTDTFLTVVLNEMSRGGTTVRPRRCRPSVGPGLLLPLRLPLDWSAAVAQK